MTQYAKFEQPLLDPAGQTVGEIYILRSFEAARARIASLYTNIVLLWLLAITAGLVPDLPAGPADRGTDQTT